MRIGVDIPVNDANGHLLDAHAMMKWAQDIEAAGLDGIWSGDASYNRGVERGGQTQADPLMRMLVAAAGTEHIEVGITVYQVPLREPVDLAQRLMTLAGFTNNRFTAGVGPGSTDQGAFADLGIPFDDRFKIFHKHMDTIRRLLKGETVGPATIPPWPETQGGPHLVLGAWYSEVSLKRAANEYDGWMSSSGRTNIGVMTEGIKRYRDLGGKRAMTTTCSINLLGEDKPLVEDEGFNLICGPKEAAERLNRVAELGFDDICCRFSPIREGVGAGHLLDADDLQEIRSLLPKDTRPIWG